MGVESTKNKSYSFLQLWIVNILSRVESIGNKLTTILLSKVESTENELTTILLMRTNVEEDEGQPVDWQSDDQIKDQMTILSSIHWRPTSW